MNYTDNYKLNLPSFNDSADISALNENFSKIDEKLKDNADAIANVKITTDTTVKEGSKNPVSGGAVYDALQNVEIDVDDAMSSTSENPVQNKVIMAYVDDAVSRVDVGILEIGKNLLDESKLQSGSLNINSGAEFDNSLFERTDFIYLEAGDYTFSNTAGAYTSYRACVYDLNKKFITSYSKSEGTTFTLTTPSLVRISDESRRLPWQLEAGTTPTEYEPYSKKIKMEYIPIDEISEEVTKTLPLEEINTIVSQVVTPTIATDQIGFVMYEDGTINATSSAAKNSRRTDYVETTGYDKVTYTTIMTATTCEIAFYDENKTYLKDVSIAGNSKVNTRTVNIPENAKYFIVSYANGEPTVEMFNSESVKHRVETLEKSVPLLNGKKIMFFGDSITDTEVVKSSRYVAPLLNYTGMVMVGNLAISGSSLTHPSTYELNGNPTSTDNKSVPNQVQKVLNNSIAYETPDIVLIFAGTNDNKEKAPLNEEQFTVALDSCDLTTFSGAMRWIYEKLMTLYPNALVIFVTPLQSAREGREYDKMVVRRNGIIENCERLALDYIDAFRVSGIYSGLEKHQEAGKYLYDGLHPNDAGGVKLAKCFQNELMKLVYKL